MRDSTRERGRSPVAVLLCVLLGLLLGVMTAACANDLADRPPLVGTGDPERSAAGSGGEPRSEPGREAESEDRSEPGPEREPYVPDRRDYAAFQSAHPDLLEPNYLPFMVHRISGSALMGDDLVFCRWSSARMPLRVYVHPLVIPESLQDEFHPVNPALYEEAVSRALETWETELEGLVRFVRVQELGDSDLAIRIRGEVAPIDHDREVLGATTALLDACEAKGWAPDSQRILVRFRVPELEIFVADRHGLLMPDQLGRVALHELGHALGMIGHSPIESDLMYAVVSDRPIAESLSPLDVNSFVSLYSLPNGSHYAAVPPGGQPERPPPWPPSGAPSLARAPHVDGRHGFEVRAPSGWLRVETPHGFFTANGPLWDYDASIELVFWPAPTIEDFLARFYDSLLEGAWLRSRRALVLDGRPALQIEFEDPSGTQAGELTFVELEDDRVLAIHVQCPASAAKAWRPWLQASVESLEIWTEPGRRANVPLR